MGAASHSNCALQDSRLRRARRAWASVDSADVRCDWSEGGAVSGEDAIGEYHVISRDCSRGTSRSDAMLVPRHITETGIASTLGCWSTLCDVREGSMMPDGSQTCTTHSPFILQIHEARFPRANQDWHIRAHIIMGSRALVQMTPPCDES